MIICLISIKEVKKKSLNAFIVAWAQFIHVNIKWLITGVLLKRGLVAAKLWAGGMKSPPFERKNAAERQISLFSKVSQATT